MPIGRLIYLYDTSDPPEEIGIRIEGSPRGDFEILYSQIPGNSWNQNRLDKFMERAQELMDLRIPLADLPADDPDKTIDPGLPNLFHDGTDLLSRNIVISNISYTEGIGLRFTLTRIR